MRRQAVLDVRLDGALGLGRAELRDDGSRHGRKVYRFEAQLALRQAPERQERVDERAHLACVEEDLLEAVLAFGVELAAVAVQQYLREPVHTPERRAEIVRHRVAERLELAIGRLGSFLGACESFRGEVPVGHVARDLGGSDHRSGGVADRRGRHRDVDRRSVLPEPHRVGSHDLPARELPEDFCFVVPPLGR